MASATEVPCWTDSDDVKWWKFPALSLNLLHLSRAGPLRLPDNLQNTLLETDLWLIQNKLSLQVSNRDQSVGGRPVRKKKPYRACSVSRQAWGLTEANVLVWPCPALLVLHTFRRVRTALRYLDYQKTPSAAQKKTLGLSVLCDLRSASPLRILLPAPLVCVFMSILTCIWCIGTSRKHPV